VQCSTDEVFGPALPGSFHAEWATQLPSNPYAASKSAKDAICTSYWRTYRVPMTITHTMNMIGERQDPEKFVPLVIAKVLKGEKVTIHGSDAFVGSRFYLHARCLADAWLWLLQQPADLVAPAYADSSEEILRPAKFNVVGEREIDNLTLAQLIAERVGKPLHYELVDFHSARPGHDRRYAMDGSKIAQAGWRHPMMLEEALDRIVAFYLAPENCYWLKEY
jgi:dTDP-glucose 4,6-dehydratase